MANSGRYFLGLDAGNTVIKAVLFDGEGHQIAMKARDGATSTPEAGHVERDLNELWANAGEVIQGCIAEAEISASQIAAVGCAGHGNGLYLLDKAGEPLVGIQSLDTRAAALSEESSQANGDALHAICLQAPWPSQTPTLLAWIKRHRADLYEQVGTVLLCKDFITLRLTGERVSEISDMSGCGLLRMPEAGYDDELLALYGLADAKPMLPRLIAPHDIAGHVTEEAAQVTGLAQGTPVIGGYFDVISSALGSGVVSSGDASIIAGTWSINQVFSDTALKDRNIFMVTGFDKDRFVNVESSATSAVNLEWYVRTFVEREGHSGNPFEQCNDLVGSITPHEDDPIFHPFLYGAGQGAEFRAGYYGLAGWHGEGHMIRALFEGVMFEHLRHINTLRKAGAGFDRAILSGGGARSPHWPQMFADGLGVPITVAEAQETGALGAAIGAAVAVGHVADYEEGVKRMTRAKSCFEPDPKMARFYERRYAIYSEITKQMRPIWTRMQEESSS